MPGSGVVDPTFTGGIARGAAFLPQTDSLPGSAPGAGAARAGSAAAPRARAATAAIRECLAVVRARRDGVPEAREAMHFPPREEMSQQPQWPPEAHRLPQLRADRPVRARHPLAHTGEIKSK
ncbi:hypothetical protein GCM10010272_22580 [Streptomyces lateritius]|nr:hypothetical protein GCM10010272_22580 [Streptomyces lateritius]